MGKAQGKSGGEENGFPGLGELHLRSQNAPEHPHEPKPIEPPFRNGVDHEKKPGTIRFSFAIMRAWQLHAGKKKFSTSWSRSSPATATRPLSKRSPAASSSSPWPPSTSTSPIWKRRDCSTGCITGAGRSTSSRRTRASAPATACPWRAESPPASPSRPPKPPSPSRSAMWWGTRTASPWRCAATRCATSTSSAATTCWSSAPGRRARERSWSLWCGERRPR